MIVSAVCRCRHANISIRAERVGILVRSPCWNISIDYRSVGSVLSPSSSHYHLIVISLLSLLLIVISLFMSYVLLHDVGVKGITNGWLQSNQYVNFSEQAYGYEI